MEVELVNLHNFALSDQENSMKMKLVKAEVMHLHLKPSQDGMNFCT